MKAYRALLAVLAIALLAAIAAWLVGNDPGYVLIQRGRWTVETSLVFAVIAFVVAWLVLALIAWLLRWPLRAMIDRSRRKGRRQFANGMLALAEGRPVRAENLLIASSRMRSLKVPALLGALAAARQRGDTKRHGELLKQLADTGDGEVAAKVLRAQSELDDGRAGTAIELLTPLDNAQRLPPGGALVLARALALRGRARETIALVSRLRRSQVASPAVLDRIEAEILAQAILQATDVINLQSLWAELNRAQRREPEVALALAQRAGQLGVGDELADEVESVLKHAWSDAVVQAWSAQTSADPAARLRRAEGWLAQHPSSAGLYVALGRLCRVLQLWGKSEEHLRRAISSGAGDIAWEELGHLYAAQKDHERAARAYANAVAVSRGDSPQSLGGRTFREDVLAPLPVAEERNEHGVPMLPRH
jgi:HemY protein